MSQETRTAVQKFFPSLSRINKMYEIARPRVFTWDSRRFYDLVVGPALPGFVQWTPQDRTALVAVLRKLHPLFCPAAHARPCRHADAAKRQNSAGASNKWCAIGE